MDPLDDADHEIARLLEVVERDGDLARAVAARFMTLGHRLPRRLHEPVGPARTA